jgi:hypothetical protein
VADPDLPTRQKKASETRTLTFAFANKLALGDTLTGTPTVTHVDPGSGLTFAGVTLSGALVSVRVAGGTDGEDYWIRAACGTTSGDLLAIDVLLEIRDRAN